MSKVPCGGFELDESLALNDGKLGLAPGAGGSQADWNVTDSADPAFIKNKPFGDVAGVQVFSSYSSSSPGTDEEGNQVFTFTDRDKCEITGRLASIKIGQKTYENIPATTSWDSGSTWTVTFDTTGLPFTVVLNSGNSGGTTVTVTSLDGSYISRIVIKDMGRTEKIKLKTEYIDTSITPSGLGYIFPTCGNLQTAKDKTHLNYDNYQKKFVPSFDMYLSSSSSSGKIFKINVDDSGNLTATEV